MTSREDYLDSCIDPGKRNMDRNRGLQANTFSEALLRAAAAEEKKTDDTDKQDHCPENFGQQFRHLVYLSSRHEIPHNINS